MWTSYSRSLCSALRLSKVQWTIRAGGRVAKTYKKPVRELQINTGEVAVCGLQHAGEGGYSLDLPGQNQPPPNGLWLAAASSRSVCPKPRL